MGDHVLFDIGPGWRLAADGQQWIVQRAGDKGAWRPLCFVGSTKALLIGLLNDFGAGISPEGQAALNALPAKFLEWRTEPQTSRSARGKASERYIAPEPRQAIPSVNSWREAA